MDRKTRRWAKRVLDTRLAEVAALPKEESSDSKEKENVEP